MVRQGHCVGAILVVLIVAVPYLSPAYAQPPPGVPHDTAGGPDFVRVQAGAPVTVLGLSKPGNRPCSGCVTYAVVQLPNGDVVMLDPKAINYHTYTVRVDTNASGPYTPKDLREFRWLPGTGGVAVLPLLGVVMLIGSGLVFRRLLN